MRGIMCHRDTMRLVGRRKPTKRAMLLAYLKKLLGIHSPNASKYTYEYDYLKARYFGGKKNG